MNTWMKAIITITKHQMDHRQDQMAMFAKLTPSPATQARILQIHLWVAPKVSKKQQGAMMYYTRSQNVLLDPDKWL